MRRAGLVWDVCNEKGGQDGEKRTVVVAGGRCAGGDVVALCRSVHAASVVAELVGRRMGWHR